MLLALNHKCCVARCGRRHDRRGGRRSAEISEIAAQRAYRVGAIADLDTPNLMYTRDRLDRIITVMDMADLRNARTTVLKAARPVNFEGIPDLISWQIRPRRDPDVNRDGSVGRQSRLPGDSARCPRPASRSRVHAWRAGFPAPPAGALFTGAASPARSRGDFAKNVLKSEPKLVCSVGILAEGREVERRISRRFSHLLRGRNVARKRRGPNLFEVMSKAPQGEVRRRRAGLLSSLLGRETRPTCSPMIVAQPLTEEEAAAELAAQREAEVAAKRAAEEERRLREENEKAREDARQARKAAKLAERGQREEARRRAAAEAAATGAGHPGVAILRIASRRLVMSFNAKGCAIGVACLGVVLLAAYSLGRRSITNPEGHGLTPALSMTMPAESSDTPRPPADRKPGVKPEAATARPSNPDLSELMRVPHSPRGTLVNPNQPASVEPPAPQAAPPIENLNYLQIESFGVTRTRSSEQLKDDVASVRKFLAERGIRTIARRLNSGGYLLFSEQGLPTGAKGEADRQAFKKRIEDLGREYRKSGGLYEFKDPLFVNHTRVQVGQPG